MFTVDIPYVPVQDTPIVVAQASTPGTQGDATSKPNYILKQCVEIPSIASPTSAERLVDPIGWISSYYYQHYRRHLEPTSASASVTLLEGPKHGKLTSVTDNVDWPMYRHDAEPGFNGQDKAIFLVKLDGKNYRVVMNFVVRPIGSFPTNVPSECPEPTLIKLNSLLLPGIGSVTAGIAALDGGALGGEGTHFISCVCASMLRLNHPRKQ